jgi:ribosomal protein S18 acetylase RimI-like enzyme
LLETSWLDRIFLTDLSGQSHHNRFVPEDEPSSQPPPGNSPEWLTELALPDGQRVRFRHVCAEDEPLMAAAINSSSRETLLHRFFSPIRSVSPDLLRQMLVLDPTRETCIVGVTEPNAVRRIICGARYVKLPKPHTAELALTVHDDFQRRGLGTFMLRLLARLAQTEDLEWFEAEVLSTNDKMLKLFRKLARGQARGHWTGDVYHLEIPVRSLNTD